MMTKINRSSFRPWFTTVGLVGIACLLSHTAQAQTRPSIAELQAQVPDGLGGMRVVMGQLGAFCALGGSTGFTIQSLSQYECLITFTTPFTETPRVVATAHQEAYTVTVTYLSTGSMRIRTYVGSSLGQVQPLSFIAIGQR